MQSVLNRKVKFRESFRPFAPSVLQESASEYFEFAPGVESPYMLLVADVRPEKRVDGEPRRAGLKGLDLLKAKRSVIPAVTHVDYSARVQTVTRDRHPAYHQLISDFQQATGCPVIINTSFNVRGEPIVCSPRGCPGLLPEHGDGRPDDGALPPLEARAAEGPAGQSGETPEGVQAGLTMTFEDINFSPDDRELRVFSVMWLAGFGVAGAVVAWRGAGWAPALWGIAAAGGAIGLVAPRAMKPVYVAWMAAAFPIGWTVSVVLLASLYYGVFTAFGLVFKAIGRDPLGRSFDETASTYWVPHRQPRRR